MEFASWLQMQMDKYNLTKYQIAKISGVHQSTIANWLNGTKAQPEKALIVKKSIEAFVQEQIYRPVSEKKEAAPVSGDGLPEGYAQLTPANRAIVDRLIADLAKSQSNS